MWGDAISPLWLLNELTRINRERVGTLAIGGRCLAKQRNNQLIVGGYDRGGTGGKIQWGGMYGETPGRCYGRQLMDKIFKRIK